MLPSDSIGTYRLATNILQSLRSFHFKFLFSISFGVCLLQESFGFPLFLLPWGFHVRACLVILSLVFLSVCKDIGIKNQSLWQRLNYFIRKRRTDIIKSEVVVRRKLSVIKVNVNIFYTTLRHSILSGNPED